MKRTRHGETVREDSRNARTSEAHRNVLQLFRQIARLSIFLDVTLRAVVVGAPQRDRGLKLEVPAAS